MIAKPSLGALGVLPVVCTIAVALWVLGYRHMDEGKPELEGAHFSYVSQGNGPYAVKEWSASVWDGQVVVGYFRQQLAPEGVQTASELEHSIAGRTGWHRDYRPLCQEAVLGLTLFGNLEPRVTNYYSPVVGARVVSESYGIVGVPVWLIVAGAGGLWGVQVLVWVKRHGRKKPGCCAECGYDLRGNLSGVCPECGSEGEGAGDGVEEGAAAGSKLGEARVSYSRGVVVQNPAMAG